MEYFERVGKKKLLKVKGELYVEQRLSNMGFSPTCDLSFTSRNCLSGRLKQLRIHILFPVLP